MTGQEIMLAVNAPHFCAAIVVVDGKVIDAAPILHYMLGWDGQRFARYCKARGWTWTVVSLEPGDDADRDGDRP